MAVISKGITLAYKKSTESEYTELTNLQEIPELGGDTDKIETTCLGDGAHMYTDGIKNYGDSATFKFLYDQAQFIELNGLAGVEHAWKVTLPGDPNVPEDKGLTYTFNGIPSVKLDGVGVNAALTYTLSVAPTGEMIPAAVV